MTQRATEPSRLAEEGAGRFRSLTAHALAVTVNAQVHAQTDVSESERRHPLTVAGPTSGIS